MAVGWTCWGESKRPPGCWLDHRVEGEVSQRGGEEEKEQVGGGRVEDGGYV